MYFKIASGFKVKNIHVELLIVYTCFKASSRSKANNIHMEESITL